MNTTAIIAWVEQRLSERSTWVGIVTLLTTFGAVVSPSHAQLIASAGAAIFGGILLLAKDKNINAAIAEALKEFAANLEANKTPLAAAAAADPTKK